MKVSTTLVLLLLTGALLVFVFVQERRQPGTSEKIALEAKPFALQPAEADEIEIDHKDGELRLRALRQPLVRAKAMQLFGMSAPEGVPVPQLNQLLHTAPGDNCPICRMRAQMEQAGNGL